MIKYKRYIILENFVYSPYIRDYTSKNKAYRYYNYLKRKYGIDISLIDNVRAIVIK